MKNNKLIIFGAGGHGKVIADLASLMGYKEINFYDDSYPQRTYLSRWPILGTCQSLLDNPLPNADYVVAIGHNITRLKIFNSLKLLGVNQPILIHPFTSISQYSSIGEGTVICAGVCISADTSIGNACILNTGCTVDHDCILSDGVHISPGANVAGGVSIGECTWIGIGAAIRQSIEISSHAIVGAGATVIRHVDIGQMVLGTPAK
ncbi:acetyltransferase [Budvicia diplopodorum]|uniref:acetyltransferase n=1 Tax=Budvicia diplopodorum TaxID=1119056 RepID=UPI00135AEA70|nr:acetyltransferase [Budvicia diplopodorum]